MQQNLGDIQNGILTMMKLIDKFPFNFKYLDYDCLIIYNDGFHNGYVALTEKDVFYEMNYDDIDIDVHGGLTFSSFGNDMDYFQYNDEGKKLYWIGFDCDHYGDVIMNGSWLWKCNKSPEYIVGEIFEMVHQIIKKNDYENAKNKKIN